MDLMHLISTLIRKLRGQPSLSPAHVIEWHAAQARRARAPRTPSGPSLAAAVWTVAL